MAKQTLLSAFFQAPSRTSSPRSGEIRKREPEPEPGKRKHKRKRTQIEGSPGTSSASPTSPIVENTVFVPNETGVDSDDSSGSTSVSDGSIIGAASEPQEQHEMKLKLDTKQHQQQQQEVETSNTTCAGTASPLHVILDEQVDTTNSISESECDVGADANANANGDAENSCDGSVLNSSLAAGTLSEKNSKSKPVSEPMPEQTQNIEDETKTSVEELKDSSSLVVSCSSNHNDDENQHLSEYEKLRLRNIRRNHERLVALGLVDPTCDPMTATGMGGVTMTGGGGSRMNASKKRRKGNGAHSNSIAKPSRTNSSTAPLRRSTRRRGTTLTTEEVNNPIGNADDSISREVEGGEKDEEEQEQFQDSPLVQYDMMSSFSSAKNKEQDEAKEGKEQGQISSLVPSGPRLLAPKANHAVYSLDIFSASCENHRGGGNHSTSSSSIDWIVGAGKSGIISIWNHSSLYVSGDITQSGDDISSNNEKEQEDDKGRLGSEPIITWKGHGGRWVADARFVPTLEDSNSSRSNHDHTFNRPSHLLTAANDGCVCLWDVRSISCQTGAPKCISMTSKNLHRGGIFSMDVSIGKNSGDVRVCTGSKDKTVAVATLESITRGIACKPLFVSHHHSAKVGCVAMQNLELSSSFSSQLIGSASDDGSVAIHDMRCNTIVADMDDAHIKPHSIVWHPRKEHIFMTAGYDDVIQTWDKRNVTVPLMSFRGHVPLTTKKCKRIHRPAFLIPTAMDSSSDEEANKDDYILTGSEQSGCLSIFQHNFSSIQHPNKDASGTPHSDGVIPVFSRGHLPDECYGDVGSIATYGSNAAVAVDGGDVLILSPQ